MPQRRPVWRHPPAVLGATGAPVIRGYAGRDSVPAGATLTLHVSTDAAASSILYKRSTFTRHAYNTASRHCAESGSSIYRNPVYQGDRSSGQPVGHKVSMHRPGGADEFMWWDAPMIAWLETNGYVVDYCTDLDLHEDADLLKPYKLLLSVGHDGYWSQTMRTNVEEFVRQGGNVAFLSANTCGWRVHLTDDNTAFVADTDHHVGDVFPHFPATDLWWRPLPEGVGDPEGSLTGVSFRNGGRCDWTSRPNLGFCAVFDCDEGGVAVATGTDGSPKSFLILGIAIPRAATMGIFTTNGTVFIAASTDWARAFGRDAYVDRITRNVLNRLGCP